ncbi:MAG: YhcN/YlaJ family sporulation lipoprotein [Alicyclobacillaceae bacterium]|nr:YhcN/YlaJ family sporulation lipoprotein [Alicyclobacillaceae bacterium]
MFFAIRRLALAGALAAGLLASCSPGPSAGPGPGPKDTGPYPSEDGTQRPEEIQNPPGERADRAPAPPPQRAPQQAGPFAAPADPDQIMRQMNDAVRRIPGVEGSTVVLAGRTALVGVDLSHTVTGSKIDSIKHSVKEAAERTGGGYRVVVTADVDLVARLRAVAAGIRQGRPVSSFSDEIADILSRILPEG